MYRRYVLSVLVENRSGVLSRISGLITRRGFNIDSLTVAETENPAISRMTIVLHCDESVVEQMKKQLEKQVDVKEVAELVEHESVTREHVMVKVAATPENRMSVLSVAEIFRANIVDVAAEAMIIELTGESNKTEAFIETVRPFGILQVVRSGITGLERGAKVPGKDRKKEEASF